MNKKGFTLVELLVVVLIIGILAAIAVPQYQKAVAKSRYSELMLLTKHIKNEQEVFYLQNGRYADNCEELGTETPSGTYLSNGRFYFYGDGTQYIACNHGAEKDRTAAITNRFGGTVSYEQRFSHRYGCRIAYYATQTATAAIQNVIKSYCGDQLYEEDTFISCGFGCPEVEEE